MRKHLFSKLWWITSSLTAGVLHAQWSGFSDPDFGGTTQYSEWDNFTTTTDAAPDVADGTNGALDETSGSGFVSSTLNIYSFSQNMEFEVAGASDSDLGQLNLQFVIWGEPENLISSPELFAEGSGSAIQPYDSSTTSDGSIFVEGFGDIAITVFDFAWDLGEVLVNAYRIDFGLAVHTSLDKVRIDTTTETLTPPPEPIVPIDVIPSMASGNMTLSFPTHPGNDYQVKWTTSLADAGPVDTWNDLGAPITGDGSTKQVTDPGSGGSDERFYSIVISN
ncbi:MAG: hypothetical protein ACOCVJ_00395 [Verrucomicrobiota bacterium]